jgi:ELWxxDGT repeat protein
MTFQDTSRKSLMFAGIAFLISAMPHLVNASPYPQLVDARAPRNAAAQKSEALSPAFTRSGRITINHKVIEDLRHQLSQKRTDEPIRIEVRPFDDVSFTVAIRRSEDVSTDPGRLVFHGAVVNPAPKNPDDQYTGSVAIAVKGKELTASIVFGPLIYEIHDLPGEGQIARIFDTRKAFGAPPIIAPAQQEQKKGGLQKPQVPQKSGSVTQIDLLVAYTSQTISGPITESVILGRINEAIGTTNHAYAESDIALKVRLAQVGRTQYPEPGHVVLETEINDLRGSSEPTLADVRRWRDQSASDLVSLWTNSPSSTACGLGVTPGSLAGLDEDSGFTVVPHRCFSGDTHALAHEVGHNMGLDHDPAAIFPPATTPGTRSPIFPYGLGFLGLTASQPFRTIMAYRTGCPWMDPNIHPCPLDLLFSNPNITRNGISAGNAALANESLAITNVKDIMAAYRSPGPLKDIQIGATGSNPNQFVAGAPGTVYFVADDGIHGSELWKSDGSRSGTVMVKDIFPGSSGSDPSALFNWNGTIYFGAINKTSFQGELWKSDGTSTGTVLVKTLGVFRIPNRFIKAGGQLYFSVGTSVTEVESLWRTDGSTGGTQSFRDAFEGQKIHRPLLVGTDSNFFFFTSDPRYSANSSYGDQLWGTTGGSLDTPLIKDIYPTTVLGAYRDAKVLYVGRAGNYIVFNASDATNDYKLWSSNGTEAGTSMISSQAYVPNTFTEVGGVSFFIAHQSGTQLWKSDGTSGGSSMIAQIKPSGDAYISQIVNANGIAYLIASNGTSGTELWKSDGTSSGTQLLKIIGAGTTNSSPVPMAAHGQSVYFVANSGSGHRLWKSNGTAAGTIPLNVPGLPADLSSVLSLEVSGDQLFFAADVAPHGRELYAVSLPIKPLPNDFSFTEQLNAETGSLRQSGPVSISGIDASTPISVVGGSYSIGCTATYQSVTTTIDNEQSVCVRHTASTSASTKTNTTLTIGGVSTTFSSVTKPPYDLTISKSGNGTGTVASGTIVPPGPAINCGPSCNGVVVTYHPDSQVTLSATAASESVFAGWSGGGCTGTGFCTVTMDAHKTVTATFQFEQDGTNTNLSSAVNPSLASQPIRLTATVSAVPSGLRAPYKSSHVPTGTMTFKLGAAVINGCQDVPLRVGAAIADCLTSDFATGSHSITAEYSGDSHYLPSTSPAFVQTVNSPSGPVLDVAKSGSAAALGVVSSSPAGISCGLDCMHDYSSGTQVTLTASIVGGVFAGWTGVSCSGGNTGLACTFTLTANTTVTAAFVPGPGANTARTDLNDDGKSDLIYKETGTGAFVGMLMNGLTVQDGQYLIGGGTPWQIVTTGDLNGDGKADLIWRNADGSHVAWFMNGLTQVSAGYLIGANTGFEVAHAGDLNGDGKADLIWYQPSTGAYVGWLMDGLTILNADYLIGGGSGYNIVQVADLNGDGRTDLIFRHTDGSHVAWFMNGLTQVSAGYLIGANTGFEVVNAGDLNGDGKADLIWFQPGTGAYVGWLMDGLTILNADYLIGGGSGYSIVNLSDLDGDGKTDLVFKHTDGSHVAWFMNGLTQVSAGYLLGANTGFEVLK